MKQTGTNVNADPRRQQLLEDIKKTKSALDFLAIFSAISRSG